MKGRVMTVAGILLATVHAASADHVLANRTLPVGRIVTPADLSVPAESMVGLEVRRAIYAGHPVAAGDLGPPTLVRRNEIVTMQFATGGIELRSEGRALGAGGAGEVIEVMNLTSRQTVRAVVVATRMVEVRR